MRRLRLLHAIHDFLPRHHAGSEIYAFDLACELSKRHDVFILAAEYDPNAAHGSLRWRAYGGLPVIELVNNWAFDRFEETYSSPRINTQLQHVLDITRPDVLHVHNLLSLSFDLPRLARSRSVPTVATLHDYTLVCPSGGQRVHVAESHVCDVIDPVRCSRCFGQSPFHTLMVATRMSAVPGSRLLGKAATFVHRRKPSITSAAVRRLPSMEVTSEGISERLVRARQLFETIQLFVAPSAVLAAEFVRLGVDPSRITVSDYGFRYSPRFERAAETRPLQIGYVGTLDWHKGAHVLIEAVARLTGEYSVRIHGDPNVNSEYSARLKREAQGLPVEFAGAFRREDLPAVYAGIDVLVVPSLWPENSPLVIHEAFLHGVAVVAARQGGIPELIADGINGLLYEAYSSEALAGRLQQLIDDRHLASSLATAAPKVKAIADDAREWEDRYSSLLKC